jgi:hypothetical protein
MPIATLKDGGNEEAGKAKPGEQVLELSRLGAMV